MVGDLKPFTLEKVICMAFVNSLILFFVNSLIIHHLLLDLISICFLKAGLLESNGREEEHYSAVTNLCTTSDGTVVAVAIQRQVSQHFLPCWHV